ncbi:MAG: YdhR family protein [Candidatus Competibacteraceae bacterium]|nr:YdhR family protein [Candidatus Competibacteraceae bacterium]
MSAVLFVRVGSEVERTKLERRVLEKKPSFLEVPGLIQKIYDRDPETGDWCGIYCFESSDVLAAFRESDLAKSIPEAYAATDVRREVFDVCTPFTQTWALSTVEASHKGHGRLTGQPSLRRGPYQQLRRGA